MCHQYGIVKSNLFFLYSNYKNKNFISKQAWASSNAIKINKKWHSCPWPANVGLSQYHIYSATLGSIL